MPVLRTSVGYSGQCQKIHRPKINDTEGWVMESGGICPSLTLISGCKRVNISKIWVFIHGIVRTDPYIGKNLPIWMGRYHWIPWPILWWQLNVIYCTVTVITVTANVQFNYLFFNISLFCLFSVLTRGYNEKKNTGTLSSIEIKR